VVSSTSRPGVRDGLDELTAAERYRVFKLLRVRGAVAEDAVNGIQMKRRKHSIDWQAILPSPHETTRLSTFPGR
jgi:hypothetical protein